MMRLQLPVALLGLLLPMMASCSSPAGRYQQATIQSRDGVPCFGVPDTHETRVNAPLVTGVSVMEVGTGGTLLWEHDFLREGTAEPALPPSQCLTYGEGAASAPTLRPGKRYQVEIWGRTPGTPGKKDEAQARVFSACFHMVDVAGKSMKPVISDCATALSSGPPPVREDGT